jgi:hypothetical protein
MLGSADAQASLRSLMSLLDELARVPSGSGDWDQKHQYTHVALCLYQNRHNRITLLEQEDFE